MTPKEKAKELVDKHYKSRGVISNVAWNQAKVHALISVETVNYALNIPEWNGDPENSPEYLGDGLFWHSVKEEINLL